MSALLYLALMIVALIVLFTLKQVNRAIDHDPGPAKGQTYPVWDAWSKWHLLGSLALAGVSCALGVDPVWAALITLLGGVGWEAIHGYVDRWDLLWDLAGAVAGVLLCAVLL